MRSLLLTLMWYCLQFSVWLQFLCCACYKHVCRLYVEYSINKLLLLQVIFGAMSKDSCRYYLRQEGNVFTCVCLFIYLVNRIIQKLLIKLYGMVGYNPGTSRLGFGGNPNLHPDPGFSLSNFTIAILATVKARLLILDSATVAKTTQRQTDKSNCYYRLLTLNPNHNLPTETGGSRWQAVMRWSQVRFDCHSTARWLVVRCRIVLMG